MLKTKCYAISTFQELDMLVIERKFSKKKTIIFIKSFLIKGLGIDWFKTIVLLIRKKHINHKILFYVDCGTDYGLSLILIKEGVNYIKLKSNKLIINKIADIANQNKVLLNPNYTVVDISKKK